MSEGRHSWFGYDDEAEVEPELVTGETSDGYHTFSELYAHRETLFIALLYSHPSLSWWSWKHDDGDMFDGMFVAGMDLPHGQIMYHLGVHNAPLMRGIKQLEHAPHWEGHTSDDVLSRLRAFINRLR